jgi:hypothetical protein
LNVLRLFSCDLIYYCSIKGLSSTHPSPWHRLEALMSAFSTQACLCLGHRGWRAALSGCRGGFLKVLRWLMLRASACGPGRRGCGREHAPQAASPYRYSMRLTTRKGRPTTKHCMMKRGGRYVHVVCVPQRVVQHVNLSHLSRNFSAATRPLPIRFGQCGCP